MNPMMTCGHAANATSNGKPSCVICCCTTVKANKPDLTGRKARCSYYGKMCDGRNSPRPHKRCMAEVDSSWELAFFEYKGGEKTDRYYCGCWGWE